MGHGLCRDVAGAAGPVVDHEGLAEDLLELAPDDAGQHVARPPRREGDDQRHRPGRIIGSDGAGGEHGDEGEGGGEDS